MQRAIPAIAAIGLAFCSATASQAQGVDSFYKGKTVTIYIGFSPGGTYDLFGRLVARHLQKHIPGNPTVVAQNMPGAGSFIAANWIYRVAPKDGTAIGIATQTIAIEEALKTQGVQYKAKEFNWLGRATSNVEITVGWYKAKVQKVEDALTNEMTIATTGAGSPSEGYHKLLNGTIGTKFKLVGPYPGSTDGLLAMERGETDAAFTSWNTLNTAKHVWIEEKKANVLVQYALERLPELKDVPTMVDLAKNPEDKQMFAFYTSGGEVGRAFFGPPGVPADRVSALRKAFDDTLKDPELLAEVEKAKLDFHPGSGELLQKIVADTSAVPESVVARMQSILSK
jgi:tripartite-type tricarboxylate transporter receptor subunit TctC